MKSTRSAAIPTTRAGACLAVLLPALALAGPPAEDARPAPQIGVAGIRAAEGGDSRDDWIPLAIEEMLTWRLRRVPGTRVIPTARLHQARQELGDAAGDAAPWPKALAALGGRTLVSGVCAGPPEAVTLELVLIDARAESAAYATTKIEPRRLFDALDEATRWLLVRLGVSSLDSAVERRIFAPPSDSVTALEYYAKALRAGRARDLDEARYFAREAVDYDAMLRPAQLVLSRMEARGDPSQRLRAAARLRRLAELARGAGDEHTRGEVEIEEGVLSLIGGQHDAAITRLAAALRRLEAVGDVYGDLTAMNYLCDAHLTRTPPPGETLSSEQSAAFARANLERGREWMRGVLAKLVELDDRISQPAAAHKLAQICEGLGDVAGAGQAYEQMLASARAAGSRKGESAASLLLGSWQRRQGKLSEAITAFRAGLALADDSARPAAEMALGETLREAQQQAEALEHFQAAQRALETGDDLQSQLVCLRNIADLRMSLGQRREAIEALQLALDIAHVLELADAQELAATLSKWKSGGP